jgi:hypothetical protein
MVRKRKVKNEETCQSGASLTATTRRNQRRFVCVYFIVFFCHTLTGERMAMLKSVRNAVAIQPTTRVPCFGSRQQTTGASFEPPGLGTLS